MIRKQVSIDPRHDTIHRRLAVRHRVTEAEIIRRAIEREAMMESIQPPWPDPNAWKEARSFILSPMAKDTVPGGRKWKREDLYEERVDRYGRHDIHCEPLFTELSIHGNSGWTQKANNPGTPRGH